MMKNGTEGDIGDQTLKIKNNNMENQTEVVRTKKIVEVPKNAQIRVDWQDYPENRTIETINRVKTYFSDKYGIAKTSIKINFV